MCLQGNIICPHVISDRVVIAFLCNKILSYFVASAVTMYLHVINDGMVYCKLVTYCVAYDISWNVINIL